MAIVYLANLTLNHRNTTVTRVPMTNSGRVTVYKPIGMKNPSTVAANTSLDMSAKYFESESS